MLSEEVKEEILKMIAESQRQMLLYNEQRLKQQDERLKQIRELKEVIKLKFKPVVHDNLTTNLEVVDNLAANLEEVDNVITTQSEVVDHLAFTTNSEAVDHLVINHGKPTLQNQVKNTAQLEAVKPSEVCNEIIQPMTSVKDTVEFTVNSVILDPLIVSEERVNKQKSLNT